MAHTHATHLTAALVVSGLMTIGCSDEGKKTAAAPNAGQPPAPIALGTNGEGIETTAPAAAIAGPPSFADGEAAYHAGNFVEASRVFGSYVEGRPGNAWGHYMLGLSAWKSGDASRAESAFEEALRIDPKHVKSLVNLSRVLLEQNRPDAAVEKLMQAGELDPDSNQVQRLLGRAYHSQGRTDEAVGAYRRAIDLDPTDGWAMNNLGLLLLEQGLAADALPLLAGAVEIRKDVPAFHNNLGMALEHTGRFSAAAEAYRAALVADAGYEKAQRNLARVEQVKTGAEEPFDRAATAQAVVVAETGDVQEVAGEEKTDETLTSEAAASR